ncbi:MAG: pyruvate, phosphate dikinase [Rhodospirillaceae bacterium]|nr:pyruvate, phosphate dikinase [Rhodospirillaceae bacterium]
MVKLSEKLVYAFGGNDADGRADMKALLGGKGANLAEMCSLGLPVPPGFTITTDVCTHFTKNNGAYPASLEKDVARRIKVIEAAMGAGFGKPGADGHLLLLSIRSGGKASMPGMMDTVLNLGLNCDTVLALAKDSGDERFAYDSYRRFIQMYGDVVMGVAHHHFEDILENFKMEKKYRLDTELSAGDWKNLVSKYLEVAETQSGEPFPQDPMEQLWGAISAVFSSWMNRRAITYRKLHGIPESWGTAVNVQAMVFGNMGETSATGVCFTRNPSTGEPHYYGEYLINAQGEDVVAGIRTPQPLTIEEKKASASHLPALEETMPDVYAQLLEIRTVLEKHFCDMQDMEFTVQQGKLWMLQTRGAKRTAKAALKIAVDMKEEGLIDQTEAIRRVEPEQINQLLHPMLDPEAECEIIGHGLPASPGAASGRLVFTSSDAEEWVARGEKVMLARIETSPEDIGGMHVAEGIITTRGGMTSHAAVVARGMGKPCVSGAGGVRIDVKKKTLSALGMVLGEGDMITIDGASGRIIKGVVPTVDPELGGDFSKLMKWADGVRKLKIRANAETPKDAAVARSFGAEGIGLCRTEHMFFEPSRIMHMREMILADCEESRRGALEKLLPYQKRDFVELFTIMEGLPVTVRLLDPPLHEFLPTRKADIEAVANDLGVKPEEIEARIVQLHEFNPMLGHRGCRLGITYPEIYEVQTRAIFEAACKLVKQKVKVIPEIMIPLVATVNEFSILKKLVDKIAAEVMDKTGVKVKYLVGTMIELPRAALAAGEIAKEAEFFSFGTNDLTQTTYGLSRDDSGKFIGIYREKGVIESDPFVTLDVKYVGELIKIGTERGRAENSKLHIGICGEHGGDPDSIRFCHKIGLDYVSCSPYRVPIARLAAAQAALGVDVETNA